LLRDRDDLVYVFSFRLLQACVIPAPAVPGLASGWTNTSIVSGRVADPAAGVKWQGWYSQAYDDAWASPTIVYDAVTTSASPTVFVWLIVPTAVRGPCPGVNSISVLSVSSGAGTVAVRVTVPGRASQDVSVTTGL
jgi:hypothetical protein